MKTDPTDPLFEALHDRLADHGHAPPAHLWANIRAQLPPPVARFRRRWGAGLLLGMLLVVGIGGFWVWQGRLAAPATVGNSKFPNSSETKPAGAARKSNQSKTASVWTTRTSNQSKTDSVWAGRTSNQSKTASIRTTRTSNLPKTASIWTARTSEDTPITSIRAGRTADGSKRKRFWVGRKPYVPKIASSRAHPAAGTFERAAIGTVPDAPGTVSIAAGVGRKHLQAVRARPSAALAAPLQRAAGQPQLTAARRPLTTPAAMRNGPQEAVSYRPAAADSLAARAVALQLLPLVVAPAALGRVTVRPYVPLPPLGGRWAVQLLAGPALTYRTLGAAPQLAGTVATVPAPSTAPLERPALGGGALLSVRRQLSAHWSVSAGLGYAEYAAGLKLRLVSPTPVSSAGASLNLSPDSLATHVSRRDSYRFLTVPVAAGYGWQPTGRWHLGLLAGAEALFYLGGTTTEGSPCACQTQTWGSSGSPYRRLSLGLRLGAEARYRIGERWELLVQPTASYLLTPLLQADAGLYPRQLWGGAALLGVAYELP